MRVAIDKNHKRPGRSRKFRRRIKPDLMAIRTASAGERRKMKEQMDHRRSAEKFEELADNDGLLDEPGRIEAYRAIGLAQGLQQGSESEVLRAWQWLGDHPEVTNNLQEWFGFRVAELKSMGRIK